MNEASMDKTLENGIALKFVTGKMVGDKSCGHVAFCRPLDDGIPDAISAVANVNSFVSCTAVANYLRLRPRCVIQAVTECNKNQSLYILKVCERGLRAKSVQDTTPVFILTPRPSNYRLFDEKAAQALMAELLAVCSDFGIERLRMTQFCLLNFPRPVHHLAGVHEAIENHQPVSLKEIVFDIDERYSEEIIAALCGED